MTFEYTRVSSHDQKDDLERQKEVLELFCGQQARTFEVIVDLCSGMNHHKKVLKRLLGEILSGRYGRLVITCKNRLLRFRAELVFATLEIITVFPARLHGERPLKNKQLLDEIKRVAEAARA